MYDGYVLGKGILSQPLAGNALTEQALARLKEHCQYEPTPSYRIIRKKNVEQGKPAEPSVRKVAHVDPSFERDARLRVAEAFKEATCEVSEWRYNEEGLRSRPNKYYEFPDGYNMGFGPMRYQITEALFNPAEFLIETEARHSKTFTLFIVYICRISRKNPWLVYNNWYLIVCKHAMLTCGHNS